MKAKKKMAGVGLPYMGSKSKLAGKLVSFIRAMHPDAINFYDLFGGGGAVAFTAKNEFQQVHYNEIDTAIVNLINELQTNGFNKEWFEPVTREMFCNRIKGDDALAGIAKVCWSFGNNTRNYLYGKKIEELKLSAHAFIVNNCEKTRAEFNRLSGINLPLFSHDSSFFDRRMMLRRTAGAGREEALRSVESLERLERVQSLERLEMVESLARLERVSCFSNISNFILTNKSYEDVGILDNSVIYCDIPYKGTSGYGHNAFNHSAFYDWALGNSNPVYISEYNMPSDFVKVASFSHRSTLSATNNSKVTEECLFWNGKLKL